jgi:hypothetical protein
MRINRAVQLWRGFEEKDQDPLQAMPVIGESMQLAPRAVLSGITLDEIRENWVAACLAFNEPRAENILAQAFARYSMETVCLEVLRQGMSEIGELWYTGRGKILTACPPGEDHIFPLLLITLFLRMRGWDVVYLGANVPLNKLDTTVQSSKPDLIVSTAQQLHTAAKLFEVAQYLLAEGVPLAYGGLIFNLLPDLRNRIPGHFLGESLDCIVQSIEQVMANPLEIADVERVPDRYIQAAAHFNEFQPIIAAYTWEQFQRNGMKEQHLEIANEFLGKDIQAGLTLGDMDFLEYELDWLAGLLQTNDIPQELLPQYLSLYKQAVEANLDQRGQLVVDWLNSVLSES